MIYVACGLIMMIVGLLWFLVPAKSQDRLSGYLSYLAQTNKDSFQFAQKMGARYNFLVGLVQFLLGLAIHFLGGDKYFLVWLLTFVIFIIIPFALTEKSLQKFLQKRHELPHDYVKPDEVKRQKVKGFRDL